MTRRSDATLVALSVLHGALLVSVPAAAIVAVGVWWNSNTIAHNFLHRPFFRDRRLNRAFALWQTAVLGIPQTLWRERHLAHHAGVDWEPRLSAALCTEVALIAGVWLTLSLAAPRLLLTAYLPGLAAGLVLCAVQGRYEHAGQAAISHYGRLYNALCLNDGYHVEHHAYPGLHWTDLPGRRCSGTRVSRWPALLRWLDGLSLELLERLVLQSGCLQQFVIGAHLRAVRRLLDGLPPPRHVVIVGGGLFPRTAIALHSVVPEAHLLIVDTSLENLQTARRIIERGNESLRRAVSFIHCHFVPDTSDLIRGTDLLVIPLAFDGHRRRIYERPPAPLVLVHDWIWRANGRSTLISPWLLKRLNLVRGQ